MRLKRILRFVLIAFGVFLGALLVFTLVSVRPIDRNVDRDDLVATMKNSIDMLKKPTSGQAGFSIGYSKVNLTPPYSTATAGHGKRIGKLFESIHDSIYVRTMVVDNGGSRVAIISADLLIIPPTVTGLLEAELPAIGFSLDNTYLGATHSHNSIGNWGKGALAIMYGSYDDSIVHFIADKIKESIVQASGNMLPATLKAGSIPLENTVRNRLIDNGPVDSLLRVVEVHRSDSSKLLLMSFSAHATCLSSRDLSLSRDYPGKLVDTLEGDGYSFVMFLAGAVGSHTGKVSNKGLTCVDEMTTNISEGFLKNKRRLTRLTDSTLVMYRIPFVLSEPQVKIRPNWRIQPWLFNKAFGDYPEFLTVLRLGNLVMLGTPCDFSGEFSASLDSLAAENSLQLMVTSFNGGYIGYVTPGKYYDEDHYETQIMNWYGPGNGEYMTQALEQLILKVSP
jgi:neutral ceramidase